MQTSSAGYGSQPVVGTAYMQDGERFFTFLFTNQQDADSFVSDMVDETGNMTAGIAQQDSGAWRVVLGRHHDA